MPIGDSGFGRPSVVKLRVAGVWGTRFGSVENYQCEFTSLGRGKKKKAKFFLTTVIAVFFDVVVFFSVVLLLLSSRESK